MTRYVVLISLWGAWCFFHSFMITSAVTGFVRKRFEKAYREANITLKINDINYEFLPVDYTYEIPLGRGKFSYEISADTTTRVLSIKVTADAPL